jgi:cell division protein ZapA (FtsZ GTPase activity inhibitor)
MHNFKVLGAMGILLTIIFSYELAQLRAKNKNLFNKSEDDKKLDQVRG